MNKPTLEARYLRTKLDTKTLKEVVRVAGLDTKSFDIVTEEIGRVGVDQVFVFKSRMHKKIFQFLKHNKFNFLKTLEMKPGIATVKCRDGYGRLHTVELFKEDYFNKSLLMLEAVERFKVYVTMHEVELFEKARNENRMPDTV